MDQPFEVVPRAGAVAMLVGRDPSPVVEWVNSVEPTARLSVRDDGIIDQHGTWVAAWPDVVVYARGEVIVFDRERFEQLNHVPEGARVWAFEMEEVA